MLGTSRKTLYTEGSARDEKLRDTCLSTLSYTRLHKEKEKEKGKIKIENENEENCHKSGSNPEQKDKELFDRLGGQSNLSQAHVTPLG